MLEWFVLRTHSRIPVAGFDVFTIDDSERMEPVVKIREALGLIATVEPRRINRMRRDVPRIVVWFGGYAGYWAASNSIMLGSRLIRESDPASIAGVLVHEATHARLRNRGVERRPNVEARIEKLCLREQIAFVERLPNSQQLVAHLRQWLEKPWWTAEQMSQRAAETLREFNASQRR